MKKLIERIKIFWSMYIVLFIIFCIGSIVITNKISKDAVSIPIIIIIAIAFIIISILSITSSQDGKLFSILYKSSRITRYIMSIFTEAYRRYGVVTKDKRLICSKCGLTYPRTHSSKCDRCGGSLHWN
ncbi:hypothetical protein OFR22_08430 [Brachyspira hyodysenteriae]|uniref:Uncharacterized protein n=2 Tax=Brachyspira murdochii TaxID=84378 RepID=D5U5I9_BRAM5|nr:MULTISPECIES: hypothetical protein [Brachyspira]ADG72466.1 hypothetical protein Bmur_2395 [Brachyspira murdochii DSM 12563]KLI38741.1 hypothetical protein SZ51_06380 [Brachyspira hyodysenteriae]MCZ9839354.1 hypothetical protein [Brachyspira hyodysenteriae]MCZ9847003.1 hypothetical protein [Brachyspira hyodysenteriae]MCZ9850823.1 hypothetical protein [Brachyspira hyodysenteriae]